ncbi:hypothetical protein T11_16454 [Trichinella zimbabwensis]|uniref:Uncharacterized protein n=1 Tax=Trichinella zimbabwensis TaxID=268475 RepID=A0A0V1HN14_9BILA|nr:hypothetical protein T11_16454 [Trichinella zimbabwensis]
MSVIPSSVMRHYKNDAENYTSAGYGICVSQLSFNDVSLLKALAFALTTFMFSASNQFQFVIVGPLPFIAIKAFLVVLASTYEETLQTSAVSVSFYFQLEFLLARSINFQNVFIRVSRPIHYKLTCWRDLAVCIGHPSCLLMPIKLYSLVHCVASGRFLWLLLDQWLSAISDRFDPGIISVLRTYQKVALKPFGYSAEKMHHIDQLWLHTGRQMWSSKNAEILTKNTESTETREKVSTEDDEVIRSHKRLKYMDDFILKEEEVRTFVPRHVTVKDEFCFVFMIQFVQKGCPSKLPLEPAETEPGLSRRHQQPPNVLSDCKSDQTEHWP